MKIILLGSLVLLGGCAAQIPVRVGAEPPPVATLTTAPRPKAAPGKARISPDDISRTRSRDGRFEATGTLLRTPNLHGSVEVRDARTRRILAKWNASTGVTSLLFSPDGRLLLVNETGRLAVWRWRSKQLLKAQSLDTGGQYRIHSIFSPDGKQVAVTFGDLKVFDAVTWKARNFPQLEQPAFVDGARWSPDGRFLALMQHDVIAFSLVEVRSGKVRGLDGVDSLSEPIFSPDSRLLAGAMNGGTFVWKVNSPGRVLVGGSGYDFRLTPIAFSPDARWLALENESGHFIVSRTRDGKRVFTSPRKADAVVWQSSRILELRSGKETKHVAIQGGAR